MFMVAGGDRKVLEGPPTGGSPRAGRLKARRSLPSGRAVTGGFAVAAAMVIVLVAYLGNGQSPGRGFVVAARALSPGTEITAGDLTTTHLHLSGTAASQVYSNPGPLLGDRLSVAVSPGELVQAGDLISAGHAVFRPLPVSVPASDLADLSAGDLADVVLTTGSGSATRTAVIATGARILSTSQPSSSDLEDNGDVVTIGVASLSQVTSIIAAEHTGTVDLIVGLPADQVSKA